MVFALVALDAQLLEQVGVAHGGKLSARSRSP
jgi:hypothetical protein